MRIITLLVAWLLLSSTAMAATWYVDGTSGSNGNAGTSSGAAFATLTFALNQASAGDVIVVAAGTYSEGPLNINKGVTLQGPNAGVLGTGSRAAEAIIQRGTASSTILSTIINVTANNVSISGFTFTGATNGTSNAISTSSADASATFTKVTGLTISNNIITNTLDNGIVLDGGSSITTASTGNTVSGNKISNITNTGTADNLTAGSKLITGFAIALRNSFYATVSNNTISGVFGGINVQSVGDMATSSPASGLQGSGSVTGNTITVTGTTATGTGSCLGQPTNPGVGILTMNIGYLSIWNVDNNTISAAGYNTSVPSTTTYTTLVLDATSPLRQYINGIYVHSTHNNANVTMSNNNISGAFMGYRLFGAYSTTSNTVTGSSINGLTINGGTIRACFYGVEVMPYVTALGSCAAFASPTAAMYYNIYGLTIKKALKRGIDVQSGFNNLLPISATIKNNTIDSTWCLATAGSSDDAAIDIQNFSSFGAVNTETFYITANTITNSLNRAIQFTTGNVTNAKTTVFVSQNTVSGTGPSGGGTNAISVTPEDVNLTRNLAVTFTNNSFTHTNNTTSLIILNPITNYTQTITANDNYFATQNGANNVVHYSSSGSGTQVVADFSRNWWGTAAMPTAGAGGANKGVIGSTLNTTLDVTPWLNSGTDADGSTPGFQPSYSTLNVGAMFNQTGATGRVAEALALSTVGNPVNNIILKRSSAALTGETVSIPGSSPTFSLNGSVVIGTGFTLNATSGLSLSTDTLTVNGGTFNLTGALTGSNLITNNAASTVSLSGTGAVTFSNSSTAVGTLTVDKLAGTVTLPSATNNVTVSVALNPTNGVINVPTGRTLTIASTATIGTPVTGYVSLTGTATFVRALTAVSNTYLFPTGPDAIGGVSGYRPITLTGTPTAANYTVSYTALGSAAGVTTTNMTTTGNTRSKIIYNIAASAGATNNFVMSLGTDPSSDFNNAYSSNNNALSIYRTAATNYTRIGQTFNSTISGTLANIGYGLASSSKFVNITNASTNQFVVGVSGGTNLPSPTGTLALSVQSGSTSLCANNNNYALLSATLAGNLGSFQWFNPSTVAISGATSSTYQTAAVGTYNAQVLNSNADVVISSGTTVTILASPGTPTISGATAICSGNSTTLTTTYSLGTNELYLWSDNSSGSSLNVSSAGTYSLRIRNSSSGCTSNTSNTITVTVNPLPTSTITPSGATTFCTGGSVTLTAPASLTSYLWSPGGATTQSISASTSGSYTVTVTDANGCQKTSNATVVTVNPLPTTPTISGATSVCSGNSLTLSTSYTLGSNEAYLWSNGGTGSSISVSTAGTYSLQIRNTSTLCTSAASNVISVTVNANPTADITPTNGTVVCSGTSKLLTASGGVSYLWDNSSTSATRTVSVAGTYIVTVTNAAGCTDVATVTITTGTTPSATITPSGATTFCSGGSVTLNAPAGLSAYAWSTGETTQSISVGTSGSYTVTTTNATGCQATSSATTVTVNTLPTATITAGGPTTFCTGGSVTLTASLGTSYSWSTGETTRLITASNSGTFTVTVTNANGCSATSSATTVTENSLPTATITAGGPTTFCAGGSVTLTASAGSSYSWSNGATTQSITATTAGSYTVTVSNGAGCSATSSATSVTASPCGITWTGGTSTNFVTPGNWSGGAAPTATDSVTIPAGVANAPTYSGNIAVKSIKINSGATFTLASGSTLTLTGHLNNAGTFTSSGTVAFAGTGQQNVTGTSTIANVTVSNTAGVVVKSGATVKVSGDLTLNAGSVMTNQGTVRLTSNSTGTARLAPLGTGAQFVGNLTQERYVPGTAGWTFLTTPVKGQTLADWSNQFAIAGFSGAPATGSSNTFYYSESATTAALGWTASTSLSNPISGTAVRQYLRSPFFSGGSKFENTGAPYVGDGQDNIASAGEAFSFPVTFTSTAFDGGGWNMVGNPFPSQIDWASATGWTRTNMEPTVWVWDKTSNQYFTYNATTQVASNASFNGIISSSQGFLVHATGSSPQLKATEAVKTASTSSFRRQGVNNNLLRVKYSSNGNEDNAVVMFYPGATRGYDAQYDAAKLYGNNTNLSVQVPGQARTLAVHAQEAPVQSEYVVLNVNGRGGSASLDFTGVASFAGYNINLYDRFTGLSTDLSQTSTYSFNITSDSLTFGGRFLLYFNNTPTAVSAKLNLNVRMYPNPAETGNVNLQVQGNTATELVVLTITDLAGKVVSTQKVTVNGAEPVTFQSPVTAGLYVVNYNGKTLNGKVKLTVK